MQVYSWSQTIFYHVVDGIFYCNAQSNNLFKKHDKPDNIQGKRMRIST